MRIVSSSEMREIESAAINKMAFGESLIIENVGMEGATWIESQARATQLPAFDEVLLLVGRGNNGADGLAIGRHLVGRGFSVRAFMLSKIDDCGDELKRQAHLAHQFGVKINEVASGRQINSYFNHSHHRCLVVDAVLGTGLRPPLSRDLSKIINMANRFPGTVVSVDIPTGVCSDTGRVGGNAIEADATLAVGLPKAGFFLGRGVEHTGQVVPLRGGLPPTLLEGGDKHLLTTEFVGQLHLERSKWKHKNAFGHTLVVGGSPGLTGAAALSAHAALRSGSGLVTATTWRESYAELSGRTPPEIMLGQIPTAVEDVEASTLNLQRWDSVVVGPGLGQTPRGRQTLMQILNYFPGPVVVDADALRMLDLGEDASTMAQRKWPTILTPHLGEFAHLGKIKVEQLLERSLDYLREVVERCNCCVVMKGVSTCVGLPNGQIYMNHFPNDGMASAGSGDVLAGILGGLLAQHPVEMRSSSQFADRSVAFNAVLLGVKAHSLAGKHAARKWGARAMKAGDIIQHLPDAFAELESQSRVEKQL